MVLHRRQLQKPEDITGWAVLHSILALLSSNSKFSRSLVQADLSKNSSRCWGYSMTLLDLLKTLQLDSSTFLKSSTMLLPGFRGWSLSWVMLTHNTPTTVEAEGETLITKKVRHQAVSSLITLHYVSNSKKENTANSASALWFFRVFLYEDVLTVNRLALLFTQATNWVLSLFTCIVNPE